VMIVVVGIFIGLQVDDWNENRKERDEENSYVIRLLGDVERSLVDLKIDMDGTDSKIADASRALSLMRSGGVTEMNRKQFSSDFTRSYAWYGISYHTDTMDELVATGKLELIRNQKIREGLAQFRLQLKNREASQEDITDMMKSVYIKLADNLAKSEDGRILTNSLSELNGDTVIYRQLRTLIEWHIALRSQQNSFDASIRKLQKVLTEQLEQSP